MGSQTNSLSGRRPVLGLLVGALGIALVSSAIAVTAAHAGGAAGGVVGSKHSQSGKQGGDVEPSGRKPGAASGSGA